MLVPRINTLVSFQLNQFQKKEDIDNRRQQTCLTFSSQV
jgi:hypothetical protein